MAGLFCSDVTVISSFLFIFWPSAVGDENQFPERCDVILLPYLHSLTLS